MAAIGGHEGVKRDRPDIANGMFLRLLHRREALQRDGEPVNDILRDFRHENVVKPLREVD